MRQDVILLFVEKVEEGKPKTINSEVKFRRLELSCSCFLLGCFEKVVRLVLINTTLLLPVFKTKTWSVVFEVKKIESTSLPGLVV